LPPMSVTTISRTQKIFWKKPKPPMAARLIETLI
jgi:hypothetical protein